MFADIHKIELLSKFSQLILTEVQDAIYTRNNPRFSLDIVKRSDVFNRIAIFLLMKTSLRYSDLELIDFKSAIEKNKISIVSKKNKFPISKSFEIKNPQLQNLFFDFNFCRDTLSYERARSVLNKIIPFTVKNILPNHHSSTHIFRHINASFLYSKTKSKSSVSILLNHHSNDACESYIHQSLINQFSN